MGTDNNNVQAYTFPANPSIERDGIISRYTGPVTHIVVSSDGKIVASGSGYICAVNFKISHLWPRLPTLGSSACNLLRLPFDLILYFDVEIKNTISNRKINLAYNVKMLTLFVICILFFFTHCDGIVLPWCRDIH